MSRKMSDIRAEALGIYKKVGYKTKNGYSPVPYSGEQKADNDYKRILKQVKKIRKKK